MKKKDKKKKKIMLALILLLIIPIIYSLNTKNPKGTNISGEFKKTQADFIYDLTYTKDQKRIHEININKEEIEIIKNAKKFLLIDFFLYNDEYDKKLSAYPAQVEQMTNLLIEKKKENPHMPILFVTDPINNFYGAYEQKYLKKLKENGIELVITDLNKMRDSNPIISGPYRAYIKYLGTGGKTYINNFFKKDGPKINIRAILKLLNFKANHRKILVSENKALVASANPHDPSAFHSNVACIFTGKAIEDLIKSESIFFDKMPDTIKNYKAVYIKDSNEELRIISEGEIFNALYKNINETKAKDQIKIGIFYLSEFRILKALGQASDRGVDVKIIADLNKDAFGIKKNGCPNRPALSELKKEHPKINIKWYKTTGEQFHTKIAYFSYKDKEPRLILGSANFTKRNLDNFNLETDVEIKMNKNSALISKFENYYDRIWNNIDGEYTKDFESGLDKNIFLRFIWKVQEKTGTCTW